MDVVAATLGGLLHDIGKFEQRGRPGRPPKHTELGADFFSRCLAEKVTAVYGREIAEEVESAIRNHHPPGHAESISLADHIAAGERFSLDEEEIQDPRTTPLIPIWHGVAAQGTVEVDGPAPSYPLSRADRPESLFPQKGVTGPLTEAYARLWREFEDEAAELPTNEALLERCLELLEKYTWCMPSAVYRSRADISLYDHLRLTAAVAACLAGVKQPTIEGEHFTLVLGDLSGIQYYLLALGRARTKGAAKRLRARSHKIASLSLYAARKILKDRGLFSTNMLASAGGKFYLLLPSREDTTEYLHRAQAELDEYCTHEYGGRLSVRLAWIACSGVQLCDFGALRRVLEERARVAKFRPLVHALQRSGRWDEHVFAYRPYGAGERPCPVCGLNPISAPSAEEEAECEVCRKERKIGTRLAKEGPHYIPRDHDGSVTEFGDLANRARGREYIAVLKADVDRLGNIFGRGLALCDPDSGTFRITISRIVAASRSLDWFFTRWLPHFLRTNHPNTYTVYAGGDDLLLIGPWNQVLDLLLDLNRNFHRYTAENPNITWSAGVFVCSPHTPVHLAVPAADNLLEAAKETDALGRENGDFGRNQVACLGTVLEWDRFEEALAQAKKLADWVDRGLLSISTLYTLVWAARQFQTFRRRRRVEALRWVPLLAYQIGRLEEPKEEGKRREWEQVLEWLVRLKENGLRDPPADQVTDLDALRLVADYAALAQGESEERENEDE